MTNINRESQADRLVKELNTKRKFGSTSSTTLAKALKMPQASVSKRIYDLREEGFRIRSYQKLDKKRGRWIAFYHIS
jgi:biotin operon repressor